MSQQHPDPRLAGRAIRASALALLATGVLAGCAGITNPYQSRATAGKSSTSSTPTPARADTADPPAERGGSIPSTAQAAQNTVAFAAPARSPQAALERYAVLYVNWRAATVGAQQRELASISLGQARAQALQAEASVARDPQLVKAQVSNSGQVVALTRGQGPAAGEWVLVTRELTTGQGDYAGLPPTLHIIYAHITDTLSGYVVSRWQPVN